MQTVAQLLALVATLSTASAGTIQGLNYGSTAEDNSAMMQADFETSFNTAKNLAGTNGAFTSARLYTMIQADTTSDVIQAIPAALATNTTLLLGLWASGDGFDNEITALKSAIATYGPQGLADNVVAISVGSEDLYRNSATSVALGGGVGQDPATLVQYIQQVKDAISGTALSGVSVGHVDTWDAWTNGSNSAVIQAIEWVGLDEYPYWQLTDSNAVDNGPSLFQTAMSATQAVIGDLPIWVTETGWAVSGPAEGDAVASTANAKTFWDNVGCAMLFGQVNTYWYTLSETGASPDFSLSDSTSNTTPLYDLSCAGINTTTTTSSSGSSSTSGSSSGSGTSSTGSSGSSGNGTSTSSSNSTVTTSKPSATGGSSGSGSTGTATGTNGAMANTASFSALFLAAAVAVFTL